METKDQPIIEIYTEANPNPNSLKFVVNFDLLPADSVDFPDVEAARFSPLAKELFQFSFVKRVFIASNFVTVTKPEDASWEEIIPILKSFIKGYIEENKPIFIEEVLPTNKAQVEDVPEDEPEVVTKIKSMLDEYVRPAVETDGGAITFASFENGVVKVYLQGACSGCPSSTVTLKQGIENLLTRMIPEVQAVEAEGI